VSLPYQSILAEGDLLLSCLSIINYDINSVSNAFSACFMLCDQFAIIRHLANYMQYQVEVIQHTVKKYFLKKRCIWVYTKMYTVIILIIARAFIRDKAFFKVGDGRLLEV